MEMNFLYKTTGHAGSTAVKRFGQFFILFRVISFTMKWNPEQGYIIIAVE